MTIEEEAVNLSKAVLKLENNGFIQALDGDDEDELECEHLRRIALHHARKIRDMARDGGAK